MTHVTIDSNSSPIFFSIYPKITKIEDIEDSKTLNSKVKVFVNGVWIGISDDPLDLYNYLKVKKYQGIINIYASIIFDYENKEIKVCNDAGI